MIKSDRKGTDILKSNEPSIIPSSLTDSSLKRTETRKLSKNSNGLFE